MRWPWRRRSAWEIALGIPLRRKPNIVKRLRRRERFK